MVEGLVRWKEMLCCPRCQGDLEFGESIIKCKKCDQGFQVLDGIPLLFWLNKTKGSVEPDITEKVKTFYEKTPFPNYDDLDDCGSLINEARKGMFVRLLDEQIPFGFRILETGCGTGQLSIFLSLANRNVFATDICLNSLRLGQDFKVRNELERVNFLQMNLFQPVFKPESFDMVICNGVLHHTFAPFTGFESISRLVKRGGYILIGLYHKYGRIRTDIVSLIFKISQDRFEFLDPRLNNKDINKIKRDTWFKDQYKNPHESKHTINEVKGWFDRLGFRFVKSFPKTKFMEGFSPEESLFKPDQAGNKFMQYLSEVGMVLSANKNGGFFIVIGQRT